MLFLFRKVPFLCYFFQPFSGFSFFSSFGSYQVVWLHDNNRDTGLGKGFGKTHWLWFADSDTLTIRSLPAMVLKDGGSMLVATMIYFTGASRQWSLTIPCCPIWAVSRENYSKSWISQVINMFHKIIMH